jgi:hypothetical protein
MSAFQSFFAVVAIFSLIFAIFFFFIDGMLLYAISFFFIFLIIGLMKVMWGVSVWADNVTRKMSRDDEFR